MRKDIDKAKEKITEWLESGVPRMEICRRLRCKYDTLKTRIDKWGLSHLKNQSRKGIRHLEQRTPAIDYLEKDGKLIHSSKLKVKLIEDGLKRGWCERCCKRRWNKQPIPLELHHKNGDRWDNRIENLEVLCPNCHAQTSNNSGKNKGRVAELRNTRLV